MTIFDIINLLLFNKKSDFEELDNEGLSNFQPFLINRWISFYSKAQTIFINETLNKYTNIFQDKADIYQLYHNLIPRQKYCRIQYIKKQKNTATEKEQSPLPHGLNISKREINLYLDLQQQLGK